MNRQPRHFFEFHGFQVDVEERRLRRNGSTIGLTSRDFDILLALVENAGKTIGKSDLMETVWPDTFVEEGNLNRHVSTLRKILGDDPRQQRLIKTIPKRGYRFTADVREIVESDETVKVETVSRSRLTVHEETTEGFWTTPRLMIAAGAMIAITGVGWLAFTGTSIRGSEGVASMRGAKSVEAFDRYTRGRSLWQTRDGHDLHNATLLLEQAVEIDTQFALAHAALADAYAFDYANWKKAEASAREAIRLDPTLGEPHAALGFVKMFWEWKLREAEDEFQRALTLSPGYATGLQWNAINLSAQGRGHAAIVEIEKALALEPDSIPINTDYCQLLYFNDRAEAGEAQCSKVLAMKPDSETARRLLYQIAMSGGRHEVAVERFIELTANSKGDSSRAAAEDLRRAYEQGGIAGFRRAQVDFYKNVTRSSYGIARVLAEAGEVEGAVSWLNNSVLKREPDMLFFVPDPAFRAIVSGPQRFTIPGRPQ